VPVSIQSHVSSAEKARGRLSIPVGSATNPAREKTRRAGPSRRKCRLKRWCLSSADALQAAIDPCGEHFGASGVVGDYEDARTGFGRVP